MKVKNKAVKQQIIPDAVQRKINVSLLPVNQTGSQGSLSAQLTSQGLCCTTGSPSSSALLDTALKFKSRLALMGFVRKIVKASAFLAPFGNAGWVWRDVVTPALHRRAGLTTGMFSCRPAFRRSPWPLVRLHHFCMKSLFKYLKIQAYYCLTGVLPIPAEHFLLLLLQGTLQ